MAEPTKPLAPVISVRSTPPISNTLHARALAGLRTSGTGLQSTQDRAKLPQVGPKAPGRGCARAENLYGPKPLWPYRPLVVGARGRRDALRPWFARGAAGGGDCFLGQSGRHHRSSGAVRSDRVDRHDWWRRPRLSSIHGIECMG